MPTSTDNDTAPTLEAGATTSSKPTFSDTIAESYEKLMAGEVTEASMVLAVNVLFPAVCALAVLIVAYFVAKLFSRWTANAICQRIDETLGKFAGKLVFYSVMMVCGLAVLQTLGVGVAGFAAVLAAAGFAIGLAFQGTLSNFAAGILLLVFRPFQVGDVVNTAGITGKVNAIDLFTTTFDTPDNRRLIVPNSAITGTTIENVTFHAERRVDISVGVDYSASLDVTRSVLAECAESFSDVMICRDDRGYQIVLSNLGASSVDWTIRFWARTEDYFLVKEALTEEVKLRLDEAGIGIPFPQMELHLPNNQTVAVQQAPSTAPGSDTTSIEPMSAPKMKTVFDEGSNKIPSPSMTQNRVRPRSRTSNESQS